MNHILVIRTSILYFIGLRQNELKEFSLVPIS